MITLTFLRHDKGGKLIGITVVHDDDFAYCGNKNFHKVVTDESKTTFKIGHEANGSFKYLGLTISQLKN